MPNCAPQDDDFHDLFSARAHCADANVPSPELDFAPHEPFDVDIFISRRDGAITGYEMARQALRAQHFTSIVL